MKKLYLCFIISVIFVKVNLIAEPTEQNLIEAWENIQKNDPKTIVFEKVGEKRYKFKTEFFPYDGEIKILNTVIDDRTEGYYYGYIIGMLEVELLNLPKDFFEKHSYSYSIWAQNNILYYDKENKKWITSKELNAKLHKDVKDDYTKQIFFNFPMIIFVLFIFLLIIISVLLQRRNYRYINDAQNITLKSFELMEKSIKLQEENNKVLKEILDILKNKWGQS